MTLADERGAPAGKERRPRWDIAVLIAIAILACCILVVVGGSAAWVLWGRLQRGTLLGAIATRRAARVVTSTPSATPALPAAPTQTATPTQPVRPTATPGAPAAATPTVTRAAPTATPMRAATPLPTATPTRVVCDGIAGLGGIVLAPGQAFRCSVGEDELNAQLAVQPNLPCRSASLTLADGAIQFTCRVGIALRATVALDAADCRASVRVVSGTPGFTQVVQGLIEQYMDMVPYDQVCVERAEVAEQEITVEGYRR
jgi:hypothetical protein